MKKTTTCASFYIEAIKKYGKTEAEYWAFAAGSVFGQAEKVFLGACKAAMFRPSPETKKPLLRIIEDICLRFGLQHVNIYGEIWVAKPRHVRLVTSLLLISMNSQAWHMRRADLCGVPAEEVDFNFHDRPGYAEYPELPKEATI